LRQFQSTTEQALSGAAAVPPPIRIGSEVLSAS
jgi:hypothetical protein